MLKYSASFFKGAPTSPQGGTVTQTLQFTKWLMGWVMGKQTITEPFINAVSTSKSHVYLIKSTWFTNKMWYTNYYKSLRNTWLWLATWGKKQSNISEYHPFSIATLYNWPLTHLSQTLHWGSRKTLNWCLQQNKYVEFRLSSPNWWESHL